MIVFYIALLNLLLAYPHSTANLISCSVFPTKSINFNLPTMLFGINNMLVVLSSLIIPFMASFNLLLILFLFTADPSFLLVIMPTFVSALGMMYAMPMLLIAFFPFLLISVNSFFVKQLVICGLFSFFLLKPFSRRLFYFLQEIHASFFFFFCAADKFALCSWAHYTFCIFYCQTVILFYKFIIFYLAKKQLAFLSTA